MHGATNHFEFNVLGTRGCVTWTFENPDVLTIGRGRDRHIVTRKTTELGSRQSPFHGTGWLEGYIEICRQVATEMHGGHGAYPMLADHLELLQAMLQADFKK